MTDGRDVSRSDRVTPIRQGGYTCRDLTDPATGDGRVDGRTDRSTDDCDVETKTDEKYSDVMADEVCDINSSKSLDAKHSTNVTLGSKSVDEMFATLTQMVRFPNSETTGPSGSK